LSNCPFFWTSPSNRKLMTGLGTVLALSIQDNYISIWNIGTVSSVVECRILSFFC